MRRHPSPRAYFGNERAEDRFIADARLHYDRSFGATESRTLVRVEYGDATTDTDQFFGAAPEIDWSNPVYTGRPASVPKYASTRNETSTQSIYLQQELTFAQRYILSAALRRDRIDTTQTNKLAGHR